MSIDITVALVSNSQSAMRVRHGPLLRYRVQVWLESHSINVGLGSHDAL